jgi:hypothetical protein
MAAASKELWTRLPELGVWNTGQLRKNNKNMTTGQEKSRQNSLVQTAGIGQL